MVSPAPSLRYGAHPLWPDRFGFKTLVGLINPSFARLLRKTDPYTLMSWRERTAVYRQAERALKNGVSGDFVEIGVHRGGSAALLASLLKAHPDRNLHLFDRWGDLPEPTEEDGVRATQYARANIPEKLAALRDGDPLGATKQVIERVIGYGNARYYAGWYDETLPTYSGGPIAFASIDCDYYESVKLALAFVSEHAAPGATMVLDDWRGWPGVKQAVSEWMADARAVVAPTPFGTAIVRLP